jgi:hypothetical protein
MFQISTLPSQYRHIFDEAVPWIVRYNPNSFPFMVPNNVTNNIIGGIIKEYGNIAWDRIC